MSEPDDSDIAIFFNIDGARDRELAIARAVEKDMTRMFGKNWNKQTRQRKSNKRKEWWQKV